MNAETAGANGNASDFAFGWVQQGQINPVTVQCLSVFDNPIDQQLLFAYQFVCALLPANCKILKSLLMLLLCCRQCLLWLRGATLLFRRPLLHNELISWCAVEAHKNPTSRWIQLPGHGGTGVCFIGSSLRTLFLLGEGECWGFRGHRISNCVIVFCPELALSCYCSAFSPVCQWCWCIIWSIFRVDYI